jgi:hypothetical protein
MVSQTLVVSVIAWCLPPVFAICPLHASYPAAALHALSDVFKAFTHDARNLVRILCSLWLHFR